ncbi:RNA polymerase sigma factor SigJ [Roseateles terrae]|uniref:RNA polymerase sigma-70 factor (ECF subfamily) n=1 Tax=Roseateles terrae TaxID=431060 RepID=A0ABR6GZ19_9BURK|nr:RNA polymerase sigma factor SigJ [Roseateles terrae]MBB3197343.1 RNA polymerase sigma-70 factor (ECF subfamily) [Roseateles terrae]OWQ83180.1 RNA polymerase subunit sigma-24 [Roseateles terrae]
MDDATDTFQALRPRLRGIAYRMLGTRFDADELVQDVWLKWHDADRSAIGNAEAWLVTVTTRLAIDRLRTARLERARYVGFWLPEPMPDAETLASASGDTSPPTPEALLERADDLSVAFLTVLERLAPEARAAFLLREVFDADYAEVAQALGKSEAACRQIVSRAKSQLKEGRPRQRVSADQHYRLLAGFADAARAGDFSRLQTLLADDAELISDGGGIVPSFGQVLAGATRIAQLYFAVWRRSERGDARQRVELVRFNGEWGLLRFIDGQLESAQSMETDGERIVRIHTQRNPEKLRSLAAALDPQTPASVTDRLPGTS